MKEKCNWRVVGSLVLITVCLASVMSPAMTQTTLNNDNVNNLTATATNEETEEIPEPAPTLTPTSTPTPTLMPTPSPSPTPSPTDTPSPVPVPSPPTIVSFYQLATSSTNVSVESVGNANHIIK